MNSLRLRLFLLIATATALVWSLAAGWTVLGARADVERVLDRRLREAAVMVASLGYATSPPVSIMNDPPAFPLPTYERQLSCQIWSFDGNLLGSSQGAPSGALSSGRPGFSELVIDGTAWRVYTYVAPETGLRVMVGDTQAMRRQLITDILKGLLIPALVGLFALALLLWIGVGRGLSPVRRIAAAIGARDPDDQNPLGVKRVPLELAPLTQEIDNLFARIARLRSGEKRFLASAAHEMQTPLAGLRIHADIALRAPDAESRERALERIRQSVDRTARLVRQLLDLARQEADDLSIEQISTVGLAADTVRDELTHVFEKHGVELHIEEKARSQEVAVSQDALSIAIRNLVENAVFYGPDHSQVIVGSNGSGFYVEDRGKGFAPEDIKAMMEPFARGTATNLPGSGLGLVIAAAALRPHYTLNFQRTESGFRVSALLL